VDTAVLVYLVVRWFGEGLARATAIAVRHLKMEMSPFSALGAVGTKNLLISKRCLFRLKNNVKGGTNWTRSYPSNTHDVSMTEDEREKNNFLIIWHKREKN